jgi:hypothetical protein
MPMLLVVDRIEGNYAICHNTDDKVKPVALSDIDLVLTEGDCLRYDNGRYELDIKATRRKKSELEAIRHQFWDLNRS